MAYLLRRLVRHSAEDDTVPNKEHEQRDGRAHQHGGADARQVAPELVRHNGIQAHGQARMQGWQWQTEVAGPNARVAVADRDQAHLTQG